MISKKCSKSTECLELKFWSCVGLQVSHRLTQNKKETLAEVVSPATFCNQPFQPLDSALPLAHQEPGSVARMVCSLYSLLPVHELRTARRAAAPAPAPTDRSCCPRCKEQERQKKQNKFTSDLQTVSSLLVWQTPEIKPFSSSFFFF